MEATQPTQTQPQGHTTQTLPFTKCEMEDAANGNGLADLGLLSHADVPVLIAVLDEYKAVILAI